MNITDTELTKSEWNTDCTMTYIPQDSLDRHQTQTIPNRITFELNSSNDHSQHSRILTKPSDSYEKSLLMINSISSSSSSPSLSFNRPKSSSPSSHNDSTRIMFNELINSNECHLQTTENDITKKLYQINSLNEISSNVNDLSSKVCTDGTDEDDYEVQSNDYNQAKLTEQLYSHLNTYKHKTEQSLTSNDYEGRQCDTYLNEITNKNSSTFYSSQQQQQQSTDMIPLTKKSRYSSPNEFNCINTLTEKSMISDNDLNETKLHHTQNSMISTTECTSTTTSSTTLFHSNEYGLDHTLSLNECNQLKKQQNDYTINELNENNIQLTCHSNYKFTGFRPYFQYPHQYHMNYSNVNNNNNNMNQYQSSYQSNDLQQHTSCQSTSPLHNYFTSFPFNRLPCYPDYMNMNLKVPEQFNVNHEHEMLHHSMMNRQTVGDYIQKSNMNTSSSSNSSNDNLTSTTTINNNSNSITNAHRNSPHININNNTVTTEQLLNSRHNIDPSFHSSILTTINESNTPVTFPPSMTNLPLNHTNPLTMSSYTRDLNDCGDNLSKLNHLNWTPTNTASHPYRGQSGYSSEFVNTTRRRNATKESTTTLKAWLHEHIKNPYPTKGEKIMLAIITKMTLTQVSTWFANARRRLKKENKMTWTPKHRGEEQNDDDDDDDDNGDDDGDEDNEENVGNTNEERRSGTCRESNNEGCYEDDENGNSDDDGDNDDDDDADAMSGSEEDLNINKLPSNQSRNHSTLKNHDYYQSFSLDKNTKMNKFAIKSNSIRPPFNKDQLYPDNGLIHTKKSGKAYTYPHISSYSTSNTSFMNQIPPNFNVSFDFLLNDQYDKINSTLNQLNTFNKVHGIPLQQQQQQQQHHHQQQQLNHSIENHLNEYCDKNDKKKFISSMNNDVIEFTSSERNQPSIISHSNWTDIMSKSLSTNKYDSMSIGSNSSHNVSFPQYIHDNLQISPYFYGIETSNKAYSINNSGSISNPINSITTINMKSNHLSGDTSLLLSPSTLSSSCSPSSCSPSSLSLITTTATTTTTTTTITSTVTTTTNSLYSNLYNFPNSMQLLTSTSIPLNYQHNHHSQIINNHERLSLVDILNPKELFTSKIHCDNDRHERITTSNLLTSNDLFTDTLNKINTINYPRSNELTTEANPPPPHHHHHNRHHNTTSTINSFWSSQLKQLTHSNENILEMNLDPIECNNVNIPFLQSITSSLSTSCITTEANTSLINTTDNHHNSIDSRQCIQNDDIPRSILCSNERLHHTYGIETNHNSFYQPIYNSVNTMPTR